MLGGDGSRVPGVLPTKLYFRIGEVADRVGVEPHVLRYWESEFRSVRPQKSARGQRVYSRRDVETLLRVKELLYSQGFTIAGAKKRLRDAGIDRLIAEELGALDVSELDRLQDAGRRIREAILGAELCRCHDVPPLRVYRGCTAKTDWA